MNPVLRRPVSVTGIIDMYIDARALRRRPTSIADDVRAVRTAVPYCELLTMTCARLRFMQFRGVKALRLRRSEIGRCG